jgi:hypothetical protein
VGAALSPVEADDEVDAVVDSDPSASSTPTTLSHPDTAVRIAKAAAKNPQHSRRCMAALYSKVSN